MSLCRRCLWVVCSGLLAWPLVAEEPLPLPAALRLNGSIGLASLSMIRSVAVPGVVQVLDDRGRTLQLGVAVSEDGYVLTKASEAPTDHSLRLAWSDGRQGVAKVVRVDPELDLLLARSDRDDAIPMAWQSSTSMTSGEWVVAMTQVDQPSLQVRLGCLSANRRGIPSHGAAMGIGMEDNLEGEGVRITEVGSESPAESAGLKPDDLLLAMDGQPMLNMRMIQRAVKAFQPGHVVQLLVRRGMQERHCSLRLASRSKVVSNWDGEDYANGGVSLRTDGFPMVLQHQVPLDPADMGGPLLNLDGQPVGLNIARVDRVTTFALPMEVFWSKVQQWMVEDRKGK